MGANTITMLTNVFLVFLTDQLHRSVDIPRAIIIIISIVLRPLLLSLSDRDFSGGDEERRGHFEY